MDVNEGVLFNDSDPDADTLTTTVVGNPANGDLTLNADGSFTYTPDSGFVEVRFVHLPGERRSRVRRCGRHDHGFESGRWLPDDSYFTAHGTVLTVSAGEGLLRNDADVDDDELQVVLVSDVQHGDLTLNADGIVHLHARRRIHRRRHVHVLRRRWSRAQPDRAGDPDGHQHRAGFATRRLLTHSQPAAVCTRPASASWRTIPISTMTHSPASVLSYPVHGTLLFNANGSFTYIPFAGYVGDDSFTYQLSDGAATSGPTTVTLHVLNTAPFTEPDFYQVARMGGRWSSPRRMAFSRTTPTMNVTRSRPRLFPWPAHGNLSFNPDGSFTYTPFAGFVGEDTFAYTLSDTATTSSATTVTISVRNAPPVIVPGQFDVLHDTTLTVPAAQGILAGAVDPDDDTITATLLADVQHGDLTLNANGSFVYVPDTGFVGIDRFTVTVSDGALRRRKWK